ncbi:histidine kinase [Balamuthia mandrillaris]
MSQLHVAQGWYGSGGEFRLENQVAPPLYPLEALWECGVVWLSLATYCLCWLCQRFRGEKAKGLGWFYALAASFPLSFCLPTFSAYFPQLFWSGLLAIGMLYLLWRQRQSSAQRPQKMLLTGLLVIAALAHLLLFLLSTNLPKAMTSLTGLILLGFLAANYSFNSFSYSTIMIALQPILYICCCYFYAPHTTAADPATLPCIASIIALISSLSIFLSLFTELFIMQREQEGKAQALQEQCHRTKELLDSFTAANIRLTKTNTHLHGKLQQRSAFLSRLLQELKHRTEASLGLISVLGDGELRPEQQSFVSQLERSASELSCFIDTANTYSNALNKLIELEAKPFNLEAFCESAISRISMKCRGFFDDKDRDVDFTYFISPDVPQNLIGDEERLGQILDQLLQNAFKFTHKGEVSLTISKTTFGITTEEAASLLSETIHDGQASVPNGEGRKLEDDGPRNRSNSRGTLDEFVCLTFAVADTGIGVPESVMDLNQLFEPLQKPAHRDYSGNRMGLSLCRELAQLFSQGRIEVISTPNKGSIFTFRATFQINLNPPREEGLAISLAGLPVYIIDDNENVCKQLTNHLSQCGCQVRSALSWAKGVNDLKKGYFRHLLLDYKMPGKNGIEVYRLLQQEYRSVFHSELAVVMMCTACQKKEVQAACPSLHTFLTKPFRKKHLLNLLLKLSSSNSEHAGRPSETVQSASDGHTSRDIALPSKQLPNELSSSENEKLCVLVAEDNKMNQKIIKMLLERLGHKCYTASNGKEALDLYANTSLEFDAIFMDCHMPVMDGWEATRIIRQRENAKSATSLIKHIPIIALTADEAKETCFEAGMSNYLAKPVKKDAFYSIIQDICEEKKRQIRTLGQHNIEQDEGRKEDKTKKKEEKENKVALLLVEDNPVNARIGSHVLRKHNYIVDVASNGKIALDCFCANPDLYTLILMDIHMPIMNGVTCTQLIREFEASHGRSPVPIVALTADTTIRQRKACIEAGCNEYLSKPVNYQLLLNTVRRFLGTTAATTPPTT